MYASLWRALNTTNTRRLLGRILDCVQTAAEMLWSWARSEMDFIFGILENVASSGFPATCLMHCREVRAIAS